MPEPFEEMYARVGGDLGALPWAELEPDRHMVAWLDGPAAPPPGRALVVGCGLGDDAEELARRGHRVTAFDVSPTAIARCRERFPASPVDHVVADVLDLPAAWAGAWDAVVEIRTVQSLEPARWPRAIATVAGLVAPGGTAFVRCFARDDGTPPGTTRPWPLSRADLAGFVAAGLVEEAFADRPDPRMRGRSITARYRRPTGRAGAAPAPGPGAATASAARGAPGSGA